MGTRSFEFARRLVEHGHEVTILCGASYLTDTPEAVEGIRVIALPIATSNKDSFLKRAFGFMSFAIRASWVALTTPCELVYASSTPLTVGLPALVAKHLRRRKMIFEVRDLWPELPKAMGIIKNGFVFGCLSWFEARCYKSADACVGLAPGIVEGIRAKAPHTRIELIPNGSDLEVFERSNHGLVPNALFTAIFCGAHGRANGLDAVLDGAAELLKRGRRDIRLQFIGDGQLKPHLIARAENEALVNCEFLSPVPKQELSAVLSGADVGLMILADIPAFRYGTSPNKFFDYIASSMPVLCNYPGWVSDMIVENRCGLVVAPGDPRAFADALIELADSQDRLPEMGKRSRLLAEREFDRDLLFERLSKLLQDLMN